MIWSSCLAPVPGGFRYRSEILGLPVGRHDLVVYRVGGDGAWSRVAAGAVARAAAAMSASSRCVACTAVNREPRAPASANTEIGEAPTEAQVHVEEVLANRLAVGS